MSKWLRRAFAGIQDPGTTPVQPGHDLYLPIRLYEDDFSPVVTVIRPIGENRFVAVNNVREVGSPGVHYRMTNSLETFFQILVHICHGALQSKVLF